MTTVQPKVFQEDKEVQMERERERERDASWVGMWTGQIDELMLSTTLKVVLHF